MIHIDQMIGNEWIRVESVQAVTFHRGDVARSNMTCEVVCFTVSDRWEAQTPGTTRAPPPPQQCADKQALHTAVPSLKQHKYLRFYNVLRDLYKYERIKGIQKYGNTRVVRSVGLRFRLRLSMNGRMAIWWQNSRWITIHQISKSWSNGNSATAFVSILPVGHSTNFDEW